MFFLKNLQSYTVMEMNIIFILLCENCINLNYVESVHSALQVYYIPSTFLFIHYTNFWECDTETPTKKS